MGRVESCVKYTPEIREWLKLNHRGKTYQELIDDLKIHFNLDVTQRSIQQIKQRIRIEDGFEFEPYKSPTRFKKGRVPFNKGLTWDEYGTPEGHKKSLKNLLKKGDIPPNALPIGTEKVKTDGYIWVKISNGNWQNNRNWKRKHRIVWEEHYGKIPKGYDILFIDGNRLNCDIDNLILVTDYELAYINHNGLKTDDKDIINLTLLLSNFRKKLKKQKGKNK